MKPVIILVILLLFASFACVPADIDSELRKSIEIVMKCQYHDPPKGPVIAVTPSRFTQIVVILHDRFKTPACIKPVKSPVNVTDERTWPFCVFGRCVQGKCQCAVHFSGPKCSIYTKKCWLMYCYLTSCHPSHQSLHCICDPSLYGTKITSGIYWYNEGKSSKYIPPPLGWKDDPASMLQWKDKSDKPSAIHKVSSDQKEHSSYIMPAKISVQELKTPSFEKIKNHELPGSQSNQKKKPFHPQAVASIPGFDSAGRVSGSIAKYRESAAGDTVAKNKGSEKTDVEEALEQLEEVSPALMLDSYSSCIVVLILLSIIFQLEAVVR